MHLFEILYLHAGSYLLLLRLQCTQKDTNKDNEKDKEELDVETLFFLLYGVHLLYLLLQGECFFETLSHGEAVYCSSSSSSSSNSSGMRTNRSKGD